MSTVPLVSVVARLDCLDQAWQRRLLQHDAVDDDLDVVLVLLVELEALVEAVHLAVDAHAREALLGQVLEELDELALSPAHDWRHDDDAIAGRAVAHDAIRDLVGCLLLDDAAADRTVRGADACVEQAQVIVDFRRRADGRARVLRGGLLVD